MKKKKTKSNIFEFSEINNIVTVTMICVDPNEGEHIMSVDKSFLPEIISGLSNIIHNRRK